VHALANDAMDDGHPTRQWGTSVRIQEARGFIEREIGGNLSQPQPSTQQQQEEYDEPHAGWGHDRLDLPDGDETDCSTDSNTTVSSSGSSGGGSYSALPAGMGEQPVADFLFAARLERLQPSMDSANPPICNVQDLHGATIYTSLASARCHPARSTLYPLGSAGSQHSCQCAASCSAVCQVIGT
jgi:hypothetical protein